MDLVAIYPEFPESLGIQRSISVAERDKIDSEDFAGPHQSFPIDSQEHLDSAAKLIGHAADPAAVKSKAIAIAKRKGFKLPEAWQENDKGDDKQERAEGMTPEQFHMYLPIDRNDATKRTVFGQATAEVPDSYGTIFGYYPEAWQKWRGNIREQHDPKKAVGKALEIEPNLQERAIYVGAKISRGAQDTWMKVEDEVLTGFSASIIPDAEFGPDPRKWPRKDYNGKSYPYLPRYSVCELSLVDNPSCPKCDIQIVRADGFATEVVDNEPEPEQQPPAETPPTPQEQQSLERAGARLSADSKEKLHGMRDAAMQMCGCDECQGMCKPDEPDGDEATAERMQRLMEPVLERSLSPVYQRQQSFLARLARFDTHYQAIQEKLSQLDEIKAVLERVATASTLEEVRASMEAMEGRVKRIEDQPAPGGPVQNGARNPYDKSNPYQPQQSTTTDRTQIQQETIERLSANGVFKTVEDQAAAAALLLRPVRMRI